MYGGNVRISGDRRYRVFKDYLREYLECRNEYSWMRLKRAIAELIVQFILDEIGKDKVIEIHYTDLVGGAIDREGIGRDIDLIVWVRRDVNVDRRRLNEDVEKILKEIFRYGYGLEFEDFVGPNIVEIHIVKDLDRDMYGRLLKRPSTTIKLWPQ